MRSSKWISLLLVLSLAVLLQGSRRADDNEDSPHWSGHHRKHFDRDFFHHHKPRDEKRKPGPLARNFDRITIPPNRKLDSSLLSLMAHPMNLKRVRLGRLHSVDGVGSTAQIHVMVKTTGGLAGLDSVLSHVSVVSGDIVGGTVRFSDLAALGNHPGVVFAQMASRRDPLLDFSRSEIGATQTTTNLCLDGTGVVVGVVDTGIDWKHKDFQDAYGMTHILKIWDQDIVPIGIGQVFTQSQIQAALPTNNTALVPSLDDYSLDAGGGHGTHVTGIAASSGQATGGFTGVAPNSSIVFTKLPDPEGPVGWADDLILDGVDFTFTEAGARPAVVNLSLGGHEGAHDGSDYLDRGLDALLGGPGRVVCVAAGNENQYDIHMRSTVPAGATFREVHFLTAPGNANDSFEIDLWLDQGASYNQVDLYDYAPGVFGTPPFNKGQVVNGSLGVANVEIDADGTMNQNGNEHIRVTIQYFTNVSATKHYSIGVYGPGTGSFEAWCMPKGLMAFYDPAGLNYLLPSKLAVPGTCKKAITVASYVTKPTTSTTIVNGPISNFSSNGPMRFHPGNAVYYPGGNVGVQKPDISAPGELIASAQSADAVPMGPLSPDGLHQLIQGTSMASPHVAGAVALLLSGNPTLTAASMKSLLQLKARPMGSANIWGAGKLDVYNSALVGPNTTQYKYDIQWPLHTDGSEFGLPARCEMVAIHGSFIYVNDRSNHRVEKLKLGGAWQATFGGTSPTGGTGDGEFRYPTDVAVSPGGFLFVVDRENERIQVFRPDDSFALKFNGADVGGTQFDDPIGIAIDSQSNIYVTEDGPTSGRIQKFHFDGTSVTFVMPIGSRGTGSNQFHGGPHFIAVSPDDQYLYVTEALPRVVRFRTNGSFDGEWPTGLTQYGIPFQSSAVRVGPDGLIYVSDLAASVAAFDFSGTRKLQILGDLSNFTGSNGIFNAPKGIDFDNCGNIYIADVGGAVVDRYKICGSTCAIALSLLNGGNGGNVTANTVRPPAVTPTPSWVPQSLEVSAEPNLSHNGEPVKFNIALPKAGRYDLTLFTLTGEVAYRASGTGNVGMNTLNWDLQNLTHQQVASGVYLYVLEVQQGNSLLRKKGKVGILH